MAACSTRSGILGALGSIRDRMNQTVKPRVLILPHVAVQGGAGLYIERVIVELAAIAELTIDGDHANEYIGGRHSSVLAGVARPLLPAYQGASSRAFLYHLLLAPVRALIWSFRLWRSRESMQGFGIILGTSSIDLLSLSIVRLFNAKIRVHCLIQENLILKGLRGYLNRWLLRRMDAIVSISATWSARASDFGIETIIAPNQFDASLSQKGIGAPTASEPGQPIKYDLLFVGGGARNKGFPFLLQFILALGARRSITVALLGNLDAQQKELIDQANRALSSSNSRIIAFGFVPDVTSFLAVSRVLLLPITAPHFCRPAIEAGLAGRTFIVSEFETLNDFAIADLNCLMRPSGDLAAWMEACERLLDDRSLRGRLAEANLRSATRFASPGTFTDAFRRLILA